jgi:hypothetical protein
VKRGRVQVTGGSDMERSGHDMRQVNDWIG